MRSGLFMLKFKQKLIFPLLLVGGLLSLSTSSHAMPTTQNLNYGLLNFSATANKKVNNDQINATLTKNIQHASSNEVAKQIANTLNKAIEIAKKYPEIQISSGNQSTYPQYDKRQKIVGWNGNASIHLKSTDIVATSQLIADLQQFMVLEGVDFSVSDTTRHQVEQDLMLQASQSFQQQAKALLPAWQAHNYQLVNIQFSKGYDYQSYDAMPVMAVAEASSSKISQQNFQAGESTISVTANGTIQLVK